MASWTVADDGHGGVTEEFKTAPASDLLLTVFSGRLMEELDISESRRLRGLGDNQPRRLLDRFA